MPSELNPADIISRRLNPEQLVNSVLWWNDPSFLTLNSEFWSNNNSIILSDVPEKKTVRFTMTCTIDQSIFDKFSSFSKLQRVMAYCLRFINNIRANGSKVTGDLTLSELNNSIIALSKIVQQTSFVDEIHSLKKSGTVSNKNKLLSLASFLDNHGLIRVGGRLRNAKLTYNQIHPIVLPSKHSFTKLLIKHEHLKNLHAGPQFILANIRRQFWPINGRSIVRSVLHICLVCLRVKPSSICPQMGNLP